jgi:hypothetical protein
MRTVFEDEKLIVKTNDSGEVFISGKESPERRGSQPELRIIVGVANRLRVTASNCNWSPTSFNGIGGFYVTKGT